MSYSLVNMCRLDEENRRKNSDFNVMLKRKLHLELWPGSEQVKCVCGKFMDLFGDNCLSCRRMPKTPLSNSIRDGLIPLLASILRLCGLINSDIAVDKETPRMVPGLPNLRPFDLSIAFDLLVYSLVLAGHQCHGGTCPAPVCHLYEGSSKNESTCIFVTVRN